MPQFPWEVLQVDLEFIAHKLPDPYVGIIWMKNEPLLLMVYLLAMHGR